jgi:hypothetical protein
MCEQVIYVQYLKYIFFFRVIENTLQVIDEINSELFDQIPLHITNLILGPTIIYELVGLEQYRVDVYISNSQTNIKTKTFKIFHAKVFPSTHNINFTIEKVAQ